MDYRHSSENQIQSIQETFRFERSTGGWNDKDDNNDWL